MKTKKKTSAVLAAMVGGLLAASANAQTMKGVHGKSDDKGACKGGCKGKAQMTVRGAHGKNENTCKGGCKKGKLQNNNAAKMRGMDKGLNKMKGADALRNTQTH